MKNAKKRLKIFIAVIMSFIVLSQAFCLPVYAISNQNVEDTDPVTTEQYDPNQDSTFVLANSDVKISDDYLSEDSYVSEIENPELTSITDSSDYELEIETRNYPEGLVLSKTQGDPMVYLTQKWLNQEYGDVPGFGSVPENGKTGWDTIYGLTRALQHELGITDLANNFGPTTERLYGQNPLRRQDGVTNRQFAILQGALWCKGYSPGYYLRENPDGTVSFDEIFNESVERAVIQLKEDAGLINPDGVVTVNVMKALMSMDAFKLLSSYGGDTKVRAMQQKLNRKYEAYTGLTPCDGVYGRNTNKAIVYALQAEEGLPLDVANGNFGVTTKKCCPQIPYGRNASTAKNYYGSYYTPSQISAMTELVQFALYVNGFGDGVTDGIFDDGTRQAIRQFQNEYALPINGIVDKTTWLSLFISCGDIDRTAKAADCATILTAAKAKSLYDNGYRYIGRYLTGTYNGGISKAITREEAEIIFDAGLNFFPIYQTSARSNEYFTPLQGEEDAYAAIEAATKLGIPKNTIIYFAVDFDCMDYQITSNIIPYFKAVHDVMSTSIYRTGIYGTRNCCTRVSENGYACSSFVGDMSTGFSGNLGYSMPENWAFDQFYTTSIGSGTGYLEIDKDGFSGRDNGVSKLDSRNIETKIELSFGDKFTGELNGPMVDIMGHKTPLFNLPFGFNIPIDDLVELTFDAKTNTCKATIGLKESQNDPKMKSKNYSEIKEMIQFFNGETTTATWNRYQKLRSKLKKLPFDLGFSFDGNVIGYIEIDAITKQVKEGGLLFIADANVSTDIPIYPPCIFLRFDLSGSMEGSINLTLKESGTYGPDGSFSFALGLTGGFAAEAIIANAFAGANGTITCQFNNFNEPFPKNFEAKLSVTAILDLSVLLWGANYEWKFPDWNLYPNDSEEQMTLYSISRNDLKFIEPIIRKSNFSSISNAFLPNVQTYCSPKIVSLGNNKMMMLYIDDASSRSAENRTILMYSIFDGSQWSAPLPVHDDGTADFNAEIHSDGNGGVDIVWQNAKALFDSDITLGEMTTSMELQYAHWNGNSFDNVVSLTDNNIYEAKYAVSSFGNNISVVWQENSENDPFDLTGTNQICRKQCINGNWQNVEIIATGLNPINSIDTSYVNDNNVIAYTAKTSSDKSSINDLETFYYDGAITQITNDNVPDYSVSFLNNELYWISNNSIVSIIDGNIDSQLTVFSTLPNSVSNIKTLQNVNGQKTIVWTQIDNSDMKIYGVNYNETTGKYTSAIPLSFGDDVIRSWDATMMPDGKIQVLYCAADLLEEPVDGKPYGQLDLIQKSADEFYDISLSQMVTYSEEVVPNEEITLSADVYNNGSKNITQLDVDIIAPDGSIIQTNIIDKELHVGESQTIQIPFVLPSQISEIEYKLKITPHNAEDVFLDDNQSAFTVGYADLAIQDVKEERTDSGRILITTIINKGYKPADGIFKVIDGGISQNIFSSNTIAQLEPGETIEFTYEIDESRLNSSISEDPLMFNMEIESNEEESNYINNNQDIYVYPDYSVVLIAGSGGTVSGAGNYIYSSTVTLTAVPNPGYIFAGWYENGKSLDNFSTTYSFTLLSNRTLEAKFIPNNLSITDIEIFGILQPDNTLTFTATAEGGNQPYLWEFKIYRGTEICYSNDDESIAFCEWTPSESGEYKVIVNITDATGFSASYTKQFTIR